MQSMKIPGVWFIELKVAETSVFKTEEIFACCTCALLFLLSLYLPDNSAVALYL